MASEGIFEANIVFLVSNYLAPVRVIRHIGYCFCGVDTHIGNVEVQQAIAVIIEEGGTRRMRLNLSSGSLGNILKMTLAIIFK